MTTGIFYVIGTLSAWTGYGCIVWALSLMVGRKPRIGVASGLAGFLLVVSALLAPGRPALSIPLVWVVMPFFGWAALTCLIGLALSLTRMVLDSSRKGLGYAIVWAASASGFVYLLKRDPSNELVFLRGTITLSIPSTLAIVAVAIGAVYAMGAASKQLRGKRAGIVVTVALLAGCVVFGVPFVWLLITSFKEDRDMAGPNGVVWVPRVERTIRFLDRVDPLLEGEFNGMWVQASLAGRNPEGDYLLEVRRPLSMQGISFTGRPGQFKVVAKDAPVVQGKGFTGFVTRELNDGKRVVRYLTPVNLKGKEGTYRPTELEPVRDIGLRTRNYIDALEAMPPETNRGLLYLRNTIFLVVMSVIGTLLSSSLVAYGFARLRFPGRDLLFKVLLATMMLPGAVTLLPQFLLFRSLGWMDTLLPLWVPAFFGGAFNVFLLRQFFRQIPMELEDAAKIDGASVLVIYWRIMLPAVKPALAVVAIWTFMGAWNNFMGPLIYINTPENMPLSYALQLFQSERGGAPGMMMAFATMTLLPVLVLFFATQKYFIEGVTLSGFGGR